MRGIKQTETNKNDNHLNAIHKDYVYLYLIFFPKLW